MTKVTFDSAGRPASYGLDAECLRNYIRYGLCTDDSDSRLATPLRRWWQRLLAAVVR